ncbi:GNAT family N-acetyltransferase [Shewanella maritima]|uniref:GNAT family N-acetyltransferase n=2 Tax=Shewanella maritima TaxID=2520507 RepID=A0A411PEQ5_9GAMM|nr:GNAT family N-acetyltransferase [Shewanella maritima]
MLIGITMQIVRYQPHHAKAISQVFHQAVQAIEHPRYSKAKLNAWSCSPRSAKYWHLRSKAYMNKSNHKPHKHCGITWVAQTHNQQVVGFINMAVGFHQAGYINHLYVLPEYAGQGIASQLLYQAQQWAETIGYAKLSADASYLSKALFEKHGFNSLHTSFQRKQNCTFNGFFVEKGL